MVPFTPLGLFRTPLDLSYKMFIMANIFSCGATQYMVLCVRMSADVLPMSGVRCPVQIYKIIFTKPMPRQIYCWQCCDLVCLLHVVVWNPPFISKDYVTVIEDDWTGTPHKMPVGMSVHEFYTPQLQRPESSFFSNVLGKIQCKTHRKLLLYDFMQFKWSI